MQRLFWKFFIIIWLTMTGSIFGLFSITALFEVKPFSEEVDRQRYDFAMEMTARLLSQHGLAVANAFVTETNTLPFPVSLSISPVPNIGTCSADPEPLLRYALKDGNCYRIAIHAAPPSMISETWPRAFPWLSALLAASIAAYWLARYLLRPVDYLRDGLSALARGRFDIRIADKMDGRRDEVAALAHDFDASAARLEEFQGAQQRLFHDVSHELRSPLSRLQAALGVLQQNPTKLETMMPRMDREIDRMDGLIGEILTLARLADTSKGELEAQVIDIIDLLNEIVDDAAFEGEARGIHVVHTGVKSFVAEVNGELIYRAFENVIRNALKFSPDNALISVSSSINFDTLLIHVTDQGPGVPPSDLERIFEPFARAESVIPRAGSGLGLAITRQAIMRHGGRVFASISRTGGLVVSLEISKSIYGNRPR